MHDINKSGWYFIIPIYNLILAVTDGTPGPNEYGEDPKGRQGATSNDTTPHVVLVQDNKISDRIILAVLIFMFCKAMVQFIMAKMGFNWTSGSVKYFYITLDLLWAFMPILLAIGIKNKDGKIIGIILASIYCVYVIYNAMQWFLRI